jgi:uncharacterized protein YdiU (UPF0061 family)
MLVKYHNSYIRIGKFKGVKMYNHKKLRIALDEVKRVREINERHELEKKMDKWFESLTTLQQADVAYNLWYNMSFADKKEEYFIE